MIFFFLKNPSQHNKKTKKQNNEKTILEYRIKINRYNECKELSFIESWIFKSYKNTLRTIIENQIWILYSNFCNSDFTESMLMILLNQY